MSWLSSATGIHISPKGVKIEPLKALGTIATAGLLPGAGSMLGGLVSKIPGVGGALSGIAHAAQGIPGVSAIIGGALKGIGGKLLPGVEGALSHPLETLGGINSAIDAGHARDLQGKAEGLALDNYNQRAPLRAAGVQGLLKPAVPDLSGVNYGSAGSVYGKRKVV